MKSKKLLSIVLTISTILLSYSTSIATENDYTSKATKEYSIEFDSNKYSEKSMLVNGKNIKYRAYEGIIYVKYPVDTKYQSMNIYVPSEYFEEKSIGNYNADSAPIFFPNSVGGYMPSLAQSPGYNNKPMNIQETNQNNTIPAAPQAEIGTTNEPNASLLALSKGYIVASPGTRGRTLENEQGINYGKAPSVIVDLKAAVRYLRYNDDLIPGDSERIISNGTSAGGGVSVLLGSSGNSSDYESYLKQIGAANEKDDIFAVMAYCPITNLDNSDMAYEWLFNGINNYTSLQFSRINGEITKTQVENTMTEEQILLSNKLKSLFSSYVNSLSLVDSNKNNLTLDSNGDGSFKSYLKSLIIESAQSALDNGEDLSKYTFLTIKADKVTDLNFDKYLEHLGRMKSAPAFDNVDLKNASAENNLFGNTNTDSQHFTNFSLENSTSNGTMADKNIIKMMNPMNYITDKNATSSKYWRIRYGTADSNTSLAIPLILALELEKNGYNVDFKMPWNVAHRGDYDLEELFSWSDSIIKQSQNKVE